LHKQEALPLPRRLRVAGVRAPEVVDKQAAAEAAPSLAFYLHNKSRR
jgi:hypothetical protein